MYFVPEVFKKGKKNKTFCFLLRVLLICWVPEQYMLSTYCKIILCSWKSPTVRMNFGSDECCVEDVRWMCWEM